MVGMRSFHCILGSCNDVYSCREDCRGVLSSLHRLGVDEGAGGGVDVAYYGLGCLDGDESASGGYQYAALTVCLQWGNARLVPFANLQQVGTVGGSVEPSLEAPVGGGGVGGEAGAVETVEPTAFGKR